MKLSVIPVICLVVTLFVANGCSNGVLETVRKVTYPPDFNYISHEKLTTTMQMFAWYMTLLDNNLRDSANVSEEQRQNSIYLLGKMEKLSQQLGSKDLSSNHRIVSFNIDQFRHNIVSAKTGLQQEPPNYYLAGSVSAYCLNCHSLSERRHP